MSDGSNLPAERGDEDLPQRRRRQASQAVGSVVAPGAEMISPEQAREQRLAQSEAIEAGQSFSRPEQEFEYWEEIRRAVLDAFVERTTGHNPIPAEELKQDERYIDLVTQVLSSNPVWATSIQPVDQARLIELLRIYQFGYGPLEDYMRMEGLEELYFNNYKQGYYILKGAKRKIEQPVFRSNQEMVEFVKLVAIENGVNFDATRANIDATLKDGSRLNATLPPMAVDGPDLVIRKHREIPWTVEDLLHSGTLTKELATDLQNWIRGGLNIVVSGGTASGKTSLLNALGNKFIPQNDRLIVVENRKELQIYTQDTKYFQTREDATKGDETKDITARDIIRWALRKRPDRIFVGELRGGEAFDALTAWNSGHNGSMCTLHANSAREALSKMEQLCGFSSARPSENAVRSLISESVDVVIQISRSRDGSRRIDEVIQVLHPYKHDSINPSAGAYVEQLKEKGILFPQRPSSDDIWIARLYQTQLDGSLRKVAQLVPLQGKAAR